MQSFYTFQNIENNLCIVAFANQFNPARREIHFKILCQIWFNTSAQISLVAQDLEQNGK